MADNYERLGRRRAVRRLRRAAAVLGGGLAAGALILSGALVVSSAPVGASSVSETGLCIGGLAESGGCIPTGGGTTSVRASTAPSFSQVFFETSGALSASDTITIDASGTGTQFDPNGEFQVETSSASGRCSVATDTVTNGGQTVTIQVPAACPASVGADVVVVLSGSMTAPPTPGSYQFQVSTSEDTTPVPTNTFTVHDVPGPPATLTATSGNGTVGLKWTAPGSDGELALTGYDVYCSTTSPPSTSGTPTTTTGATVTSASLTGLTNGTTEYCVVTAVNSDGQSAASVLVSPKPHATRPSHPLRAAGKNGLGTITVSWKAPTTDGGAAITSYDLYCSTTNPPSTTGTPSATVAAPGAMSASLTGLPIGQTYYCVVTALNSVGPSKASNLVTVHSAVAPGAPTSPQAVPVGTGEVEVVWTPPKHTGGVPLLYYIVYCSPSNPPTVTPSDACGATDAPATNLYVGSLASGVKWYFVVAAGNSVRESGPSAVASTLVP